MNLNMSNEKLIALISKERSEGKLKIDMVSKLIDNGFNKEDAQKLIEKADEYRTTNASLGLGGWLIFVAFGIISSTIIMTLQVLGDIRNLFSNNVWEILTSVESAQYSNYIVTFVSIELILNLVLVIGSNYLIYLFFTKHYLFPKAFIILFIGNFIFLMLTIVVSLSIFPQAEVITTISIKELGKLFVAIIIWVPYMLMSKRVKGTFVKKFPIKTIRV